ncbi:MAG: hypothetical protein ACOC2E_07275 [Bacteroidota bacterium]
MKKTTNYILPLATAMIILIMTAGGVYGASYFMTPPKDDGKYLGSEFGFLNKVDITLNEDKYHVYYLGKLASNQNQLTAKNTGQIFFSSTSTVGDNKQIFLDDDVWLYDPATNKGTDLLSNNVNGAPGVNFFQADEPVLFTGGMLNSQSFDTSWIFIGFNDGWSGDSDYNDLLLAAKAVPLPGAVWLLASGLMAFIGFGRKFRFMKK